MRIALIVLTTSLIAACVTAPPVTERWLQAEHEEFTLFYTPGLAEDGRIIGRLSQDSITRLLEQFSIDRATWQDRNDLVIFVHGTIGDDAGPGNAVIRTTRSTNGVKGQIHVLAPSAHPAHVTTAAGLPFDDAYFAKLVTHEISTMFLEYLTSTKRSGWDIYSAPSWFVQGYQEYLGLTHSSVDSKHIADAYHLRAKQDRDRVNVILDVESDYIDGALLVEFLHDRFSDTAVQGLLNSAEPDFWTALFEETGLTVATLQAAYTEWLVTAR